MTIADQIAAIREELAALYQRQREAERADAESRVVDYATWRAAIDNRAERIRVLERQADELEREHAQDAEREAA